MDLRIRKTYKALIAAFTALMEENQYEKITVAMICERAMIRRTTFYKHFKDKNAFFAFYIDGLRISLVQQDEQAQERTGGARSADFHEARRKIFTDLIDLILEHEQLMDNILRSSMSGVMLDIIAEKVTEAIRERLRSDPEADPGMSTAAVADFIAGGIMRLFQTWWKSGRSRASVEELAGAVDELIGRIMRVA